VTRELARTLAQAGLTEITFSLDDARPKEAAMLAGTSGYLDEAKLAIQALLEAGLSLEVNAVVTSLNIDYLEPLVALGVALGTPKLTFSDYTLPLNPRSAAVRLVDPTINLQRRLEKLCQQYGHLIDLQLGTSSAIGTGQEPCDQNAVCDVGFRDLHVLPDGRVTRCRYLPEHDELVVGSLQAQSIMEIWNGDKLSALSDPYQTAYEKTDCQGCGSFQTCNRRGRCYFTALTRSSRLYAPDDFCQQ
jgi:radical SAM protein with 4Fe4S-binding SPASM domain